MADDREGSHEVRQSLQDDLADVTVPKDKAVSFLARSKLPKDTLERIFTMVDIGGEGEIDEEEWCAAMHLVTRCKAGDDLPEFLPEALGGKPPTPPPAEPPPPEPAAASFADLGGLGLLDAAPSAQPTGSGGAGASSVDDGGGGFGGGFGDFGGGFGSGDFGGSSDIGRCGGGFGSSDFGGGGGFGSGDFGGSGFGDFTTSHGSTPPVPEVSTFGASVPEPPPTAKKDTPKTAAALDLQVDLLSLAKTPEVASAAAAPSAAPPAVETSFDDLGGGSGLAPLMAPVGDPLRPPSAPPAPSPRTSLSPDLQMRMKSTLATPPQGTVAVLSAAGGEAAVAAAEAALRDEQDGLAVIRRQRDAAESLSHELRGASPQSRRSGSSASASGRRRRRSSLPSAASARSTQLSSRCSKPSSLRRRRRSLNSAPRLERRRSGWFPSSSRCKA